LSVPGVLSENLYLSTDPSGSLALINDVKVIVWPVDRETLVGPVIVGGRFIGAVTSIARIVYVPVPLT